jgi:hypothetical protein
MNTSLVAGNLLGITVEQLGTAKSATASLASEWTSAMTSIAPRQHHAEDSLVSAWAMIGTILSCLAIMMAVVIAAATTMP